MSRGSTENTGPLEPGDPWVQPALRGTSDPRDRRDPQGTSGKKELRYKRGFRKIDANVKGRGEESNYKLRP